MENPAHLNTRLEDIRMKPRIAVTVIFASLLVAGLLLVPSAPSQPAERRIEVTAKRFDFSPGEITLKKGEPVRLVLKSADVPHGIRFRELGVEVKVGKGQTSETTFTPDKVGTFVGHCSVFCGSGHGGMELTLHVTE
jgi:cytochrome c oxidase subunit 2